MSEAIEQGTSEESRINQLVLDYQRLYLEHLGQIFASPESRKWLHQYLSGKLYSDKRKRPFHSEMMSLITKLEGGPRISSRDVAFYLNEARLRWDEYNEILETSALFKHKTPEDIRLLKLQLDRISAEIIELSLRSIKAISAKYAKRHNEEPGYYWGTAVLGLMKGLMRWDATKASFGGYIFSWMLNEISETHTHRGLITPPGRLTQDIAALEQKSHELWGKLERPPNEEELAVALNQTVAYVKRLQREHLSVASLDAQHDPDGDPESTLHNSLPMSYSDDRGGAIHRSDSASIVEIIRDSVISSLDKTDGMFGLRLNAEAFIEVQGPHRVLSDAIKRLRQVGMLDLKSHLRKERPPKSLPG
jgi:DNA-directed RNA polymerase specialized sigma subunit